MEYTWKDDGGARRLYADGRHIATLAPFEHPAVESTDEIAPVGDGVFEWTRRYKLRPGAPAADVRLTMDLVAPWRATYAMIPAVSYDGNQWGSGLEPKGFRRDGVPWAFAFHRTSIAGATYSEGDAWSVALFGRTPAADCGFSCALIPDAGETTHRLIWPEEETPLVYRERDKYAEPFVGRLTLQPGQIFAATAYIVVAPVTRPRTAWRKLLDEAWKLNYRPQRPRYSPQETWQLGMTYAKDAVWAEEGVFKGFSIGLVWDGQKWLQRPTRKYEIGWAGQNASLACSLLHDYLNTRDQSSLDKGLATLDTWARHGRFESGLINAIIDPVIGLKRKDIHDACNLGNAAADYLEAYDLARQCGAERPEYKELALGICDFMLAQQLPDGRYGRAWSRDGTCLDRDGTIGAFVIPGMIAAHRATGRGEYLASAERAYECYYSGLRTQGFTTAGALDTDCIDKESAWPLLDAGLSLYDLTGDRGYLDAVEAAAYYTATWQYHFSVPTPAGSMFEDMQYDSFGGTAVSTQHHHIDPYAVRCVPMWLRLAELTGNRLWEQRALAAWCNGMMGLSDGTLKLRGTKPARPMIPSQAESCHRAVTLPRGTQCEGYFQTRWLEHGDSSFLLVAWPTAFRLETLRHLSDWSALAGQVR